MRVDDSKEKELRNKAIQSMQKKKSNSSYSS